MLGQAHPLVATGRAGNSNLTWRSLLDTTVLVFTLSRTLEYTLKLIYVRVLTATLAPSPLTRVTCCGGRLCVGRLCVVSSTSGF